MHNRTDAFVIVEFVIVDLSTVDPPVTLDEVNVDVMIVEPSMLLLVNVESETTEFAHVVLVHVFPVPGQSPKEPVPNRDEIRKK